MQTATTVVILVICGNRYRYTYMNAAPYRDVLPTEAKNTAVQEAFLSHSHTPEKTHVYLKPDPLVAAHDGQRKQSLPGISWQYMYMYAAGIGSAMHSGE